MGKHTPHLIYTTTDRGFRHLPALEMDYGTQVRVYESSAAEGPYIWLSIEDVSNNYIGAAHISLQRAVELRDQLDWLIENHYQER